MKRTKVQVERQTEKAYLIIDEQGRKGWIQKRWLAADGTVAEKTINRADANYKEHQASYAEAKEHANSYHQIINKVRETEKAIAISVTLDFCDVEKYYKKMIWIPRSLVKDNAIPGWFINKKLNELLEDYRMDFNRYGSVIIDSVGVADYDDRCYCM